MTIYIKTNVGQRAFQERSILLSHRQRAAFILIDGQRHMDAVLAGTAGLGLTVADFEHMVSNGLIQPTLPTNTSAATMPTVTPTVASPVAATPALSDAELYQRAYPLATRITADLGLRGFRLNLAVEAASGLEDLVALLPKIQAAVGDEKCRPLAAALRR